MKNSSQSFNRIKFRIFSHYCDLDYSNNNHEHNDDCGTKEMKYSGFSIEVDSNGDIKNIHNTSFSDCILMQCTGIKDKNDKDVYEGDIVSVIEYGIINILKVVWNKYDLQWFLSDGDEGWSFNVPLKSYYVRVIGNIYENPELMKGG